MKVRALTEIPTARGIIPAGQIIIIPDHLAERLKGKVEPIIDTSPFRGTISTDMEDEEEISDGRHLPHYCEFGNGWCSEKLPGSNYPAGCIRLHCEHYHASQDAPQTTTEEQGILALQ